MALSVTHRFVSLKPEQSDPTIIGPHEWNDTHVVTGGGLPFLVSTDFIFASQTPGGNLNIGSNVITMNPLPAGVAVGGSLYISGGTGIAEAVPITGISGNNVIVTCANTHSGAWTIQSATAGIQEAIGSGSVDIYIPVGNYNIYSQINVTSGVYIHGGGQLGTVLYPMVASMIVFNLNTIPGYANVEISNFQIDAALNFPAINTITAVSVSQCYNVKIADLFINNCSKGIIIDRGHSIMIDSINTLGNVTLWVGSTANSGPQLTYPWPSATYSNSVMISSWNGFNLTLNGNANVPVMTFQFASTCYVSKAQMATGDPSRVGILVNNHCEDIVISQVGTSGFTPAVSINNSGWTRVEDCSIACATGGIGIKLASGYSTIIESCHLNGPANLFIDIEDAGSGYPPTYVLVSGNEIQGVTTGAGISIQPNINGFTIVGNSFLNSASPGPTNDIYIAPGASDYFTIVGNSMNYGSPPANPLNDNSTGTHKIIQANLNIGPYNSLGPTLASSAAINVTNKVHKVSGTAAIATINFFGTINAGEQIYLIPTGAFTTTAAGNISIASAAVVGRTLTMVWDGAKWNPSY